MKSVLLCSVTLALLLNASCKKNDSGGSASSQGTGALQSNSWTITQSPQKVSANVEIYAATTVQATGAQLIGTEVKGAVINTFRLTFNGSSLPATQGYYKIVAANPGPDEVAIQTVCNTCSANYTATGNDGVYAKVSILNQKVRVSVVSFWAKLTPSATDSVQIYGNLNQP